MTTKRVGKYKTVLVGVAFLAVFGWLALLTVHQVMRDGGGSDVHSDENLGRQKRQLAGSGNSANPGGAIYIRWGRTQCPNDAELVYKGFAGGDHFTHVGGGSNYVCLTETPKYSGFNPAEQAHAVIYGVELQVHGMNLFSTANSNPNDLPDSDVQCAVCRSQARTSMVMIPGTNECPTTDWNREYWGYLMSAHYAHKGKHPYVCVDNAPEKGAEGGSSSEDGGLMYHVEGRCGSLPCQPYKNAAELTCVVCTK